MTTPMHLIPPFVPLPKANETALAQPKASRPPGKRPLDESDIDRFATLFSPATPPASPVPIFGGGVPTTSATAQRPHQHRTHGSADSEFGSFVSVPPTQDPLSFSFPSSEQQVTETRYYESNATSTPASGGSAGTHRSGGANSNTTLDYFDQFTSTAKTSSERNKRGVLDELLQHEDDPLYWVQPLPQPGSQEDVPSGRMRSHSKSKNQRPVSHSPAPRPIALPPASLPLSSSASSLPLSTSPPSVSPPPPGALSRLSSSWVSAFLPSARSRASTSTSASLPPSAFTSTHSASNTISHHPHPPLHPSVMEITHGTPFGSAPYVPPSGAPGFAGDHTWDKGFSNAFEPENDRVEKKNIRLVGRREGTAEVLSVELADKIRPHLPALTRLPRTWTLLYSLDQHGISLNTLYTRCEPKPWNAPGATKGALIIIRDSGDAVFGAWMGEGVHLSKGAYYGSGES
ncbi:hypothetical protein BV22DRAFT_1035518 [Leucogyrophana mollusca]|uniref:Uncharacterized protein n=1 Tax=Leucogyrophana mollusca TaxID=85980 RepID=A0ACB8BEC6_9AGAM|nr:hypothetical protein BV22DRAFT_1035518 [Leucogyrophana mollusca]